jgi:hypothetical protein
LDCSSCAPYNYTNKEEEEEDHLRTVVAAEAVTFLTV